MDDLETSLVATVYEACGNTGGKIVEIFFKPIASTMFFHLVYLMDSPGPSISITGTHEEFFSSGFGIWVCGGKIRWFLKTNQDAQRMEVFRNRVEYIVTALNFDT